MKPTATPSKNAKKSSAAKTARTSAKTSARPPTKARAARRPRLDPAAEEARLASILDGLDRLYPDATCELDFTSPFQLLVATILSAQCTDKVVNQVTPALFARYPDARALAAADVVVVEGLVSRTGFYRNKAKNIVGTAARLVAGHGAEVPRTMEALVALPGVARKTANVVLGTGFGLEEGFVVDTHIGRLARRLGLTRHDDPVKVERDLVARIPRPRWTRTGHQLIWHGRRLCQARKPDCARCPLASLCPSSGTM